MDHCTVRNSFRGMGTDFAAALAPRVSCTVLAYHCSTGRLLWHTGSLARCLIRNSGEQSYVAWWIWLSANCAFVPTRVYASLHRDESNRHQILGSTSPPRLRLNLLLGVKKSSQRG